MSHPLELLPLACFALQGRPGQSELSCTAINQQARQLLGLQAGAAESALLASLEQLLAVEERPGFRRCWHGARGEQRPFSWEGQLTPGAPHRWLRLQLAPDGQGGWQGVLIDISELREQVEKSRHILNEVPIAIAISALEGSNPPITFLNAEFERRFGWGRRQLRRLADWAERAYPDPAYREAVISQWLKAVERARHAAGSVAGMEFQVHTAWGEVRDVLFSGRVIGNELLVTLLDVTERRRSERELGEARDALARSALAVTAAIPVGTYVLALDPQGTPSFRFLSERWLQMLQLSRAEVLADPLLAFRRVHPDDREAFEARNAAVFASGERFYWEGRIVVEQQTRWVSIESIPRRLADGSTLWEGVMIDITERIAAQQRLERVLNNIPVAIAIQTLEPGDAEVTFLNEHFIRTIGYTRNELRRVSDWAQLAYPDPAYRQEVFRDWNAAMGRAMTHQGTVEQAEYRVRSADGRELQLLISAVVLSDMALIAMVDVTERRRSERELMQARDALARTALEITEAIPVGTYTMVLRPGSPMASFSFMSERFLELTGLQRQEALADPLRAFACVHPDDYDAWVRLNAEVFEKKLPFFGQTRVVVNGEVRWITAESVPRDLPDGSTVWEGVLIDVTERIEAQQRLERVLNNIPVAIAINSLDPLDPEITFLNDHFIRTIGYTRSSIPRVSDWARLAYPDPAYRDVVFRDWNAAMARAMAQRGTVEQAEYRVRSADGRELQLLISAVVLPDMVLIALVDVTRSREAERQLLEALERERQQEELLRKGIEEKLRVSLSASAVAHEISQPLGAIRINSELALRSLQSSQPEVALLRGLLEPIAAEAQRMDLITDRIRMLLRQVHTERQPLDLAEVAASALLQIQPALQRAGVKLSWDRPQQPCTLSGDAVQLQLALLNLLRNALDAIAEATPAEPQVELCLRRQGDALELSVADNGPGFPDTFNPQLPLTSTKARGSGIGLYVVRLTVENHGGSLSIGRSAQLGGAEVTLHLPAD